MQLQEAKRTGLKTRHYKKRQLALGSRAFKEQA